MKGLFWNIRGVGNFEKLGHLQDIIKENRVDFIGLQETLKQDYSADLLKKLGGGKDMAWAWVPASGKSGGILVGVNQEKLELKNACMGKYYVKMELLDLDKKN